jgi:Domain of unknown function (DUF4384)
MGTMRARMTSLSARKVRLGAMAAIVLVLPALAQSDDDNTRAVKLLDQPLAPAPSPPPVGPTPNVLPPLVTPQPPAATSLPPLVAPAQPTATQPSPPPVVAPMPQLVPPPSPVVTAPPPKPPVVAAPKAAPAPPASKSGPSTFQVMSLPPIEVRVPPTPAEIGNLNSSIKVANSSEVAIDILPGADITVGSRVSFRVSTKKPGYLILVDVDAVGKLTQIYPSAVSRGSTAARPNANYVGPGKPLQIPNPDDAFAGFEFVASPPFGTAMVVAILSDRPVQTLNLPDIPATMTGQTAALTYLTKLASDLRIPGEGGGRTQEARWSFDAKFYAIR